MTGPPPRPRCPVPAFTLIELLVVVVIIGILAALLLSSMSAARKNQRIKLAQAQLGQMKGAIGNYAAKRGHLPPDNPGRPELNPLLFELKGTTLTHVGGQPYYVTLDGASRIAASDLNTLFGPDVKGFMNFPGAGGDDTLAPLPFLTDLLPSQVGRMVVGSETLDALLVCSVRWSDDPALQIIPTTGNPHAVEAGLNPWRYVRSSPVNNPGSYDLWVDLYFGGKTNRICNWSDKPLGL